MTTSRTDALRTLAADLSRAGDGLPGAWDRFALVAEITALGVRVTGFRYLGDGPGLVLVVDDEVIADVAAVRAASPGPNGELFDTYVLRFNRASGQIVDQAYSAAGGAMYRVTAANTAAIAELVRPDGEPGPTPAVTDVTSVDEARAALTTDVLTWAADPEVDWTTYGGVVRRLGGPDAAATGQLSLGFVYGQTWAAPHLVGGQFHAHLRDLLAAAPLVAGAAPGAALLRLTDRQSQLQARFLYPPESDRIQFGAADDDLLDKLRPRADAAPAGRVPRPSPDGLDPAALQERVEADLTASLRGVDPWHTFALAVDLPQRRVAAFVYEADGTAQRFEPALSPVADLSELREQTARPDGAKWAGVIVHAWPGSRVDLMYYGPEAISTFLDAGPDAAAPLMRPPAEPPGERPGPPWPPGGGHLDRDALATEVSAAVFAAPELAGPDWDRLAVVVFPDGLGAPGGPGDGSVDAVRFAGDHGPAVLTRLAGLGPIGKLGRAISIEDGVRAEAVVLRGHRGAARLDAYGFSGESAQRLRGGSSRMIELADWLRPS